MTICGHYLFQLIDIKEEIEDEQEEKEEGNDAYQATVSAFPFPASHQPYSIAKRKHWTDIQHQNEPLMAPCNHLPESDEDVVAKGWALKLKRMKREQRIYAEKFINDVLLEGELGTLHRHSFQVNGSSNTRFTPSPDSYYTS